VLILCFSGFEKLFQHPSLKTVRRLLPTIVLLGQIFLSALAFRSIFLRNALEQNIARDITEYKNIASSDLLYSFDIDVALESRGVPFEIRNLWQSKYEKFEIGSLVLFNEEKLGKQWEGLNPMVNWNHLKTTYSLILLREFDDNWKLYRIDL
jgi:hypothetical protein